MTKQKIIICFLAASFLININSAFCEPIQNLDKSKTPAKEKKKPSLKTSASSSKTIKAAAEESKVQSENNIWWDKFNDPILKGYILKSINDNYDLKIAALKTKQANAVVREYLGKEFPSLDMELSYLRYKTSDNTGSGSGVKRNDFLFPLNVFFELDIFRKNRDMTLSKKKEYESTLYDEKSFYTTLRCTVAAVYFNIIGVDRQLEIQKEIVDLRKSILDMMKENNKYGLVSTTDVVNADKAFTESLSALSDLKKQQSILLNQFAILIGDSSENSSSLKRASIDEVQLIADLPKKIESEVVLKKSSVKKVEAELEKARIDVRLARKDFLPSFPITGQFGFNANSFSKSFNWDSYILSGGVGIAQSLFTGGQKRAVLKAKKFKYQEMIENYQKTILEKFQEINDCLASLKFDTEKNKNNLDRLKMERENMGVINNRYALGAISLLETLQHKERVYSLEKEQIQSKTDCLTDSVNLYDAVGGRL